MIIETHTNYSRTPGFGPMFELPIWWHKHGAKMSLSKENNNPEIIRIENGKAASLSINANLEATEKALKEHFSVEWFIKSSQNEEVYGKRLMNPDILQAAFGIAPLPIDQQPGSVWLIDRFGADSAHQGDFIRWQNYLNIPGPGTGHDHDPNLSILIDDDIREAVYRLLILKVNH